MYVCFYDASELTTITLMQRSWNTPAFVSRGSHRASSRACRSRSRRLSIPPLGSTRVNVFSCCRTVGNTGVRESQRVGSTSSNHETNGITRIFSMGCLYHLGRSPSDLIIRQFTLSIARLLHPSSNPYELLSGQRPQSAEVACSVETLASRWTASTLAHIVVVVGCGEQEQVTS